MQVLKGETMQLISEEDQKVIKKYINVINSKTDEAYKIINAAIMNYLTKRLELHDC